MKRSELFFSLLRVPTDFAMLLAAAAAAFVLRDILPRWLDIPERLFEFPFEKFMIIAVATAPFFLLLYALEGLYDIRVTKKFTGEIWSVTRATTIGLMVIIVAGFLNRDWFSSRIIILSGWVLAIIFVVAARVALREIQRWLLVKKGIGTHRVLLLGAGGASKTIRRYISTHPASGYKVVAQLETPHLREIKEIRRRKGVDEIIVADASLPDSVMEKLIDYCHLNDITVRFVPTSLQMTSFDFTTFAGEPLITVKHTPLDGWGRVFKRVFDVVAATILIVLFAPVMLILAWLIKRQDPDGPVVYKNERIGAGGKKFFVYKFRYMRWKYCITKENPAWREALEFEKKLIATRSVRQGPLYKIKDDPRKTKIGSFIERYSLDELLQLFNVLQGSMSLVGPRPHQEREVEKYRRRHRRLLTIKPGLTGLAQVS
ncbi:MAG TPA: sugar transferase, partial [Candidatus Moranbacteria bacterium]|nr:sugar transferase [Candidatus Moranbacteria bacterium]